MLGPCKGGAVRLAAPGATLMVADGLETALSVWIATGIPTWAALSAGGIRSLILPPLPLASGVIIAAGAYAVGLREVSFGELNGMEFPPRDMVLGPILPTQGIAMVYAPRGLGKTYFALALGYAVAVGSSFLRWGAPRKRRVLYLDGEMAAVLMRQRLGQVSAGSYATTVPTDDFRLICGDLQNDVAIDISSKTGQQLIEAHLDDVDLLILDNLACVMHSGGENEGDSWLPVQQWLLSLRRRGKSVLIAHHAGKTGAQRGTSRR